MKKLIKKLLEIDGICRLDVEKKEIDVMSGINKDVLQQIGDALVDCKGWTVNIIVPHFEFDQELFREVIRRAFNL